VPGSETVAYLRSNGRQFGLFYLPGVLSRCQTSVVASFSNPLESRQAALISTTAVASHAEIAVLSFREANPLDQDSPL
jgi:hypothetical protein